LAENLSGSVKGNCSPLPNKSFQEVNPEIRVNGGSEENSGRRIQKDNQQAPQFQLQDATWGIPLRIELRKESPNEQGQSLPKDNQDESSFTNDKGQSSIQDNQAVETHNLQSSEGQLGKPSSSVEVDVIATSCHVPELGNARSDDLLALQFSEGQLEHDLLGKAEVVSSLNLEPKILVSASRYTNCSLVKCETPPCSFQERRREMKEIKHFLKKDSRFCKIIQRIRETGPAD
jgi:hypothetical protein